MFNMTNTKEAQIKPTVRSHLTLIRTTPVKAGRRGPGQQLGGRALAQHARSPGLHPSAVKPPHQPESHTVEEVE